MKTGVSSNIERKPGAAERKRKYQERQERRWKAKCGPVTVRFVDPETLRKGDAERKR